MMPGPEALAPLVAGARRGEHASIDALYRRFAPVVHGVLLARVQRADADDLVQDVFGRALSHLDDLRDAEAFPGWLLGIARRAALDQLRRARPLTELPVDTAAVSTSHEDRLDAEHALAAIRALPEAYREPLMLRLVEGLTGPEIAARTGLTPGSVRVNLHRGFAQLRAVLEGRHA